MTTARKRTPRSKADDAAAAAALLKPHLPTVLEKLRELAALGDPKAIQQFLSYTVGLPRPAPELIHLPEFSAAPTLQGKVDAIANAVTTGKLSLEAGEKLGRFLDVAARVAVIDELAARIEALEAGSKARTVEAVELLP